MHSKSNHFQFLFFILLPALSCSAQLQDELPRQAHWGASFHSPTPTRAGAVVRSVTNGGFAAQIDLQPGDVILRINNTLLDSPLKKEEWLSTANWVRGGSEVTLEVLRDGKLFQKKGTLPAMPKETFPKIVTEYKSILSPYGYRVQVIVTRPEGVRGKVPGIFLVRWMSCDPIEKPVNRKHGVARMLEDFVTKSGYAVMRVEKPGLGDSEGPPCYQADFAHELAAHREAYKAFKKLAFIDSTRIIVFGQSNGAAYAPAVPDRQPAAYIVSGGWTKTWFEHMLEYKRRDYERSMLTPQEVNRKMSLEIEFYTEYLLHKKLPGNILAQKPHLAEVWGDEPDHQWGLPSTYIQQLQGFNPATAWMKVNVPTYVFYGEYDFAMVEQDHQQIARWVNANGAGLATYEFIPKMEHSLFWFENEKATDDFYGKGVYHDELANKLINWMRQKVK